MKKFCAITPTRGDRPLFLEHCKMQMQKQTVLPGDHFIIDYPARSGDFDLVERYQQGIALAMSKGYDIVYFIEDDDYYPDDYFERMDIGKNDIIGLPYTWYYHLDTRSYIRMNHPGRSSMFCTGLRISRFMDFDWPDKLTIFVDILLWKHLALQRFEMIAPFPIGIKHSAGLRAGNGHNLNFPFTASDPGCDWLKHHVRPESFEFYMNYKQENA